MLLSRRRVVILVPHYILIYNTPHRKCFLLQIIIIKEERNLDGVLFIIISSLFYLKRRNFGVRRGGFHVEYVRQCPSMLLGGCVRHSTTGSGAKSNDWWVYHKVFVHNETTIMNTRNELSWQRWREIHLSSPFYSLSPISLSSRSHNLKAGPHT